MLPACTLSMLPPTAAAINSMPGSPSAEALNFSMMAAALTAGCVMRIAWLFAMPSSTFGVLGDAVFAFPLMSRSFYGPT
ncbi:hypothetical protein FZC33_20785 [Labrys sp. KNU-23]|nr:hypothetical protein FZC33_20785 [Labrys sp. KNU-23]